MKIKETSNTVKALQYSITFAINAVLTTILTFFFGILNSWEVLHEKTNWNFNSELTKNMFVLSNASFIPGVLTLGLGLFILAADGGAFEMLVYGMTRFISLFKKNSKEVRFATFYDYHVYNSEQDKTPFLFLILVGAFFIVLSIIFVVIYSNNM